ncbi:hypothetical protein FYJ43_02535 [Cutibacterium sp. WCA-380-WT-3A]|uniref:YdhG-like domain-containing protein n=1 Tax=Cutibacterium porci TaxID=2605781 RepID=A0A7K0J4T1_9ACTN|nr:DUF1801 domain-containing protein [Cutibacterium porci]MSS44946.1 hypothetical protein [Cutibacterium porci]
MTLDRAIAHATPPEDADRIDAWLMAIPSDSNRQRVSTLLNEALRTHPSLVLVWKWNMPMLTDHGSFIASWSASAKHLALAFEAATLDTFTERIVDAGYTRSKKMWQVKWDQPAPWPLISDMLDHAIDAKKDCATFWAR